MCLFMLTASIVVVHLVNGTVSLDIHKATGFLHLVDGKRDGFMLTEET